jgi:hypothetical protein
MPSGARNQSSTGLALAMVAQEKAAKAFVLALVRDEVIPWTDEVRRSLVADGQRGPTKQAAL